MHHINIHNVINIIRIGLIIYVHYLEIDFIMLERHTVIQRNNELLKVRRNH